MNTTENNFNELKKICEQLHLLLTLSTSLLNNADENDVNDILFYLVRKSILSSYIDCQRALSYFKHNVP